MFGRYHYTEAVGPLMFGEVPLLIPLTWFVMLYPSHVITNLAVDGQPVSRFRGLPRLFFNALVGALVMSAWDLTLDPYMVTFEKAWVWDQPGAYFGIPIHNYVGWVATSFVILATWRLLELRIPDVPVDHLQAWFWALPLFTYAFMSIGDIALGQPVATILISPFAMGIVLLVAFGRLFWRPKGKVKEDRRAQVTASARTGMA